MTNTFSNDNDVIIYTFETVFASARRTQQIFVAQCVWWLAGIIGLEQGLIVHIDNLRSRETQVVGTPVEASQDSQDRLDLDHITADIDSDRNIPRSNLREILATPRELTQDMQIGKALHSAKRLLEELGRAWNQWQHNWVNPFLQTKRQLKKARRIERLQKEINTAMDFRH
jgi:hypothetical protein